MKWENLSKLIDIIDEDIEKAGYFEMVMQKNEYRTIDVIRE